MVNAICPDGVGITTMRVDPMAQRLRGRAGAVRPFLTCGV
jgi:hypothetical protein